MQDNSPKDKKPCHPDGFYREIEELVEDDGGGKPEKKTGRNRMDDPTMYGDTCEHGEEDKFYHQKTAQPDGEQFDGGAIRSLVKHDEKRDYRGDEGKEKPNCCGGVRVDIGKKAAQDAHNKKEQYLLGGGKGGGKQKCGGGTAEDTRHGKMCFKLRHAYYP